MALLNDNVILEAWEVRTEIHWSYKVFGEISKIFITYDGNGVNSVKFISKDGNGTTYESDVLGTENGTKKEITIDSNVEKLISIEGSVGTHNSVKRVTSLGFTTSKAKHAPVGTGKVDTEFSCLLTENPFDGFHGSYSTVLNSIGISIGVVNTMELAGPWLMNSQGGAAFDYTSKGSISQISVSYEDDIICSLQFTSQDADGTLHKSPIFGKPDGHKYTQEIQIDTSVEKITGIAGAYGPYAGTTLVKSLAFITSSMRIIGPFGTQEAQDTPFAYPVQAGSLLAGFHGRNGWYIDSIGVHIQRGGSAKVGSFSASNADGRSWSYEPQGLIYRIFGYSKGAFDRIQFESIDENGVKHTSNYFGENAHDKYTVDIGKDDRVTGISGTYSNHSDGKKRISGLYIYTKTKTHGPFGDLQKGTKFSFKVKTGYISGFHGRSSDSCYAIGIYMKQT